MFSPYTARFVNFNMTTATQDDGMYHEIFVTNIANKLLPIDNRVVNYSQFAYSKLMLIRVKGPEISEL